MNAPTHELPALPDGAEEGGAGAGLSVSDSDAGGSGNGTDGVAASPELAGQSDGVASEVRHSEETLVIPEKTTAWSEEELTGGREATDYKPKLPEWVVAFSPGETFNVNGWECKTLHVGNEDGHWLILMQPQRPLGTFVPKSRAASRVEFKGLVRKIGKKKAKKLVKERAAKRAAATENAEA